jgi:hypothetical protein
MNKGKRKPVQAATSGKKAPGARKPRKAVVPIYEHEDGGLTYVQRRFVGAYVDNGGNASAAYAFANPRVTRGSARFFACQLMKQEHIIDAIETMQEEIAQALNISRMKLLRIQVAMATATVDEFTAVFRWPGDKESYRDLGDNKYAIKSIKTGEHGNELQLFDRQEAINELWEKLGFAKTPDIGGERDVTGSVLETALEILGREEGEGSK